MLTVATVGHDRCQQTPEGLGLSRTLRIYFLTAFVRAPRHGCFAELKSGRYRGSAWRGKTLARPRYCKHTRLRLNLRQGHGSAASTSARHCASALGVGGRWRHDAAGLVARNLLSRGSQVGTAQHGLDGPACDRSHLVGPPPAPTSLGRILLTRP
jgi:hypothetical protein